jgi:hypothetical protein
VVFSFPALSLHGSGGILMRKASLLLAMRLNTQSKAPAIAYALHIQGIKNFIFSSSSLVKPTPLDARSKV